MRKRCTTAIGSLQGEGGRIKNLVSRISIIAFIFFFTFTAIPGFSQHNFVLFNMSQLPQANFQNPGQEIWMNGYLILPGLSGARVDLYSGGPLLNQMGLKGNFSLNNVLIESLNTENNLSANAGSTLLGFGFKTKSGFFHIKFRENFVSDIRYPKALFELVDNYNAEVSSVNNYVVNPLNINASHYRSYSLGYTHRFAKLSIGANFQYLQGIANLNISDNSLNVLYSKDKGGYSVEGKLEALTAGVGMYTNPTASNFIKGSGNSGFAVDLGGTIHFSPKFELSFAAADLGKIFWKKHISKTALLDETTVFQAKDSEEFAEELTSNFEALFDDEIISGNDVSYQTPLRQKYLLGAKYFLTPSTNVGLMVHSDVLNGEANFGGALSLNTQYKKFIGFSLAVSKYKNESFDMGTGINFNLGPVQIYALTDNLISLFTQDKAHRLNGRAGINFIFGRKTRNEAVVLPTDLPAVQPESAIAFQNEIAQPDVFTEKSPISLVEAIEKNEPALEEADVKEMTGSELPVGYFEYKAQVSDSETNMPLSDVKIKIYRLHSRSIQILVHSETAVDGAFSVPISRIDSHRVVIQKPGYHELEKEYAPGTISEDVESLSLYFFLIPEVDNTTVIYTTVESAIAELTNFSFDATQITKKTYGTYRLTGSTSLRKGAHYTEEILRRLRTGETVELLEKTSNLWWKVKYRNRTGYVKAGYLEKE